MYSAIERIIDKYKDDDRGFLSRYFRSSLVRANYKKFDCNIFEDISFLEKFFSNLLTDSKYELKNRYTHIDYDQSANKDDLKCNNCTLEEQLL